jgi:hypothetical protein
MQKPTLVLMQLAEKGLVCEIIGLCNLLHARVTAIHHRHKVTNVCHVCEIVGDVTHRVHNAFHLVLDARNRGFERRPFGALDKIGSWVYLFIVVHKRNLALSGQARRDLRGNHAPNVSTVPGLLENNLQKKRP